MPAETSSHPSQVDRASVFGETVAGDAERFAPGWFPKDMEREHIARYRWASRWAPGATVLDVASGIGYGSQMLWRSGAGRVVAVDISAPALGFAQKEYGGPCYVRADAEALPFRASAFDVVVSFETVEHLARPSRFLGELGRVLRPGGVLCLSTPNRLRYRVGNPNPHHVHEFDLRELTAGLQAASFRVADVLGQHWMLTHGVFRKVRGFRRLAYALSQGPWVIAAPLVRGIPVFWCVCAVRQ